jgi:CcmD family protein
MKTFNKIVALCALLCTAIPALAQFEDRMNDVFYSSGKIKVVIAVAAVILLGILAYVLRLDRKVSRIEKLLRKK